MRDMQLSDRAWMWIVVVAFHFMICGLIYGLTDNWIPVVTFIVPSVFWFRHDVKVRPPFRALAGIFLYAVVTVLFWAIGRHVHL